MKKIFKTFLFITVLLGCIILPNSCRVDMESENKQSSTLNNITQTTRRVRDAILFKEFISTHKNSFVVKNNSKISNSFISLIEDENLVIEIKNGDNITYSFYNYNEDKSFDILVYVYNTKEKSDFSFISKFTPQYQDKNFTVIDFIGKIDYIDEDGNLIGTTSRNEGKPVEGNSKDKTSSGSVSKLISCDWYLTETPHQCTEGGSHWPWEVCSGNENTLPYWEVGFEQICTGNTPRAQIADVGLSGGGAGSGGSSVYQMASYDGINYMLYQIGLENLTSQQYNFLQDHVGISNYLRDFLFAQTNINNSNFVKWCINYLSTNYIASNYFSNSPHDLDILVVDDIDLTDVDNVEMVNSSASIIIDILINQQNGSLNNLESSWPNIETLKAKIKNAISKGVYTTAKYTRDYLYLPLYKLGVKHPSTIYWSNKAIDKVRIEAVTPLVNFNENTMGWGDLFNIWLFELTPGNYTNNTINFTNASNVVNGNNIYNPTTNAVKNFPKGEPSILPNIKSGLADGTLGTGSFYSGTFVYNVNAFYSTLSNVNVGIQMLGSYPIKATILSKSGNTAVVKFYIENFLGLASGTRFIKGSPGQFNQGVIDDKDVGTGLHLGGTIKNTFTWTETINF